MYIGNMHTYSSLFCCNGSNCLENKAAFFFLLLLYAAEHCSMQYAQFQLDLYPHHHVLTYAMNGFTVMKVTWPFPLLYVQNTFFEGWKFPCFFLNPATEHFGDLWIWRMVEWNLTGTSLLLYRFRTKPTILISIKNYYHHLKQLKQKKLAQT